MPFRREINRNHWHCWMQITFDAMCSMLLSITDVSLLRRIERDCSTVSDAMLSFPVMIPGTRYYKGIKVEFATCRIHYVVTSRLI